MLSIPKLGLEDRFSRNMTWGGGGVYCHKQVEATVKKLTDKSEVLVPPVDLFWNAGKHATARIHNITSETTARGPMVSSITETCSNVADGLTAESVHSLI